MTFTTLFTELDGALRTRMGPLAHRIRAVWQQRTPREQALLRGGAILLIVALFWVLALRPASQTIQAAHQQLPLLQAQAARLGEVILEAKALARGRSGIIPAGDTEQALQTSLRAVGLETVSVLSRPNGAAAKATQWQVQFVNAPAGRVMEWMANLPFVVQMQTHRVDLARSNVNGRDRPGQLSGLVVLTQTSQRKPS
ncbi:MAG TPA: type II secretion system protein GspM [Pusillimonas sp.]